MEFFQREIKYIKQWKFYMQMKGQLSTESARTTEDRWVREQIQSVSDVGQTNS
jgi:hypothetical protein